MRRALVTGIGGQDGSLLAELLVAGGYRVTGTVRSLGTPHENLAGLLDSVELVELDLEDAAAVSALLDRLRPGEVYNLASISHVPVSWEEPVPVARVAAIGVTGLLEAIRTVDPAIRFFQASSSELFGEPRETPQTESTPVAPLTPYGAAKAYGHFLTGAFRRRYGLHACSGILFNHESPRRPVHFVTRKVTRGAAAISLGLESELRLGDLEVRRDWGYAGDYVRAMWLALQAGRPDDYVIATGEAHSVGELARVAFGHVGLDWREHVRSDEALVRGDSDARERVGSPARARDRLGWEPSLGFEELVRLMVDADLERLRAPAP